MRRRFGLWLNSVFLYGITRGADEKEISPKARRVFVIVMVLALTVPASLLLFLSFKSGNFMSGIFALLIFAIAVRKVIVFIKNAKR